MTAGVGAGRASVSVAGSIGDRAYPSGPRRPTRFRGPAQFCQNPAVSEPRPPVAPARPTRLVHRRRRAHRPVVLAARARRPRGARVPRAENTYTATRSRTSRRCGGELYDEIVGRVQETDTTAPIRRGGYEYFTRTLQGLQYGVHCRRPASAARCPIRSPRRDARRRARGPRRERAGRGPRLLRGGRSRRRTRRRRSPRTAPTRAAASATTCASARSPTARGRRTRPRRRRARRLLRRGVGERRRDHPLHASRRGHAPVAGLAAHARDAARRRRARVPGGRRPLLRERRSHAQRSLPRDHLGVEGDDARCGWSTPTTPTARAGVVEPREQGHEYHVEHHAGPAGDRLFVLTNADGAENFALAVTPVGDTRPRVVDDRPRAPATTPASTTSTRSPASWWCRSAPTRLERLRVLDPRRRRRGRRRPRDRDARSGVLRVARRQPRVRRDDRPLPVHVAGVAGVGLRLRPRRRAPRRW